MKILCSHALICASLTMSAAASAQPITAEKAPANLKGDRCGPAQCTIVVSVTECNKPGGVRIDKPLVRFDDSGWITWKIDTPGFAFADAAVWIEGDDPSDTVFEQQTKTAPNEVKLRNRNHVMGEFDFRYTLQVQGCVPVQAWIRNVAL